MLHLVFLTCMLLLSFSSINPPVSWLMIRTQSFWYGRLLPLNTVIGGVEPFGNRLQHVENAEMHIRRERILKRWALTGMCGNVMVTSSPFPTCNSPSQDVSIDAGLKSSVKEKQHTFVSWSITILHLPHSTVYLPLLLFFETLTNQWRDGQ